MTGLDTNIVVRFLMADHPAQYAQADALFQTFSSQKPGFISVVCLAEVVWVLRSIYRQPKSEIMMWLTRFLESSKLVIEDQEAVTQAVFRYGAGKAEFSDCLIERIGRLNGCRRTLTFDKQAAKAAGMSLLRS